MNYRLFISSLAIAVAITGAASAQEDGSEVILPLEAQTCNLPAAPSRIPDQPSYDDLVTAKANIATFQASLGEYRTCLDAAQGGGSLTDGNQIALNQAHNYSVEMEERVAEQFNVAVRAYKAAQGN